MTFRLPTQDSLTSSNTATIGVTKTRAALIPITIAGMLPFSSFTFFVDGVDMTWATAQAGKRMGEGLLSDEFGRVNFNYYAEIGYNNTRSRNTTTKYHQLQLKNLRGESKATTIITQTLRAKT